MIYTIRYNYLKKKNFTACLQKTKADPHTLYSYTSQKFRNIPEGVIDKMVLVTNFNN